MAGGYNCGRRSCRVAECGWKMGCGAGVRCGRSGEVVGVGVRVAMGLGMGGNEVREVGEVGEEEVGEVGEERSDGHTTSFFYKVILYLESLELLDK